MMYTIGPTISPTAAPTTNPSTVPTAIPSAPPTTQPTGHPGPFGQGLTLTLLRHGGTGTQVPDFFRWKVEREVAAFVYARSSVRPGDFETINVTLSPDASIYTVVLAFRRHPTLDVYVASAAATAVVEPPVLVVSRSDDADYFTLDAAAPGLFPGAQAPSMAPTMWPTRHPSGALGGVQLGAANPKTPENAGAGDEPTIILAGIAGGFALSIAIVAVLRRGHKRHLQAEAQPGASLDMGGGGASPQRATVVMIKGPNERWGLGVGIDPESGWPTVLSIRPETVAARYAEVTRGMRLIAIDGARLPAGITAAQMAQIIGQTVTGDSRLVLELEAPAGVRMREPVVLGDVAPGDRGAVQEWPEPTAIAPPLQVVVMSRSPGERWGCGFRVPTGGVGPLISRIVPESVAARHPQLRPGCPVLRINGHNVSRAPSMKKVLPHIERGGDTLVLVLGVQPIPSVRREVVTMSKAPDEIWGVRAGLKAGTGPVVNSVIPGTAAARYPQLVPGARMLTVNHEDVTQFATVSQLTPMFRKAGNSVRLAYEVIITPPVTDLATTRSRVIMTKRPHESWGCGFRVDPGDCPRIGAIVQGSVASHHVRLQPGARLLAIGGQDVTRLSTAAQLVPLVKQSEDRLALELDAAVLQVAVRRPKVQRDVVVMERQPGESWGCEFKWDGPTDPYIDTVVPGSVAARHSKLQPGCRVLRINGQDVAHASAMVLPLIEAAGNALELSIERTLVKRFELVLTKQPCERWGAEFKSDGPAGPHIGKVAPGSVAARHPQLKPGAKLIEIDGVNVSKASARALTGRVEASGDELRLLLEAPAEIMEMVPVANAGVSGIPLPNVTPAPQEVMEPTMVLNGLKTAGLSYADARQIPALVLGLGEERLKALDGPVRGDAELVTDTAAVLSALRSAGVGYACAARIPGLADRMGDAQLRQYLDASAPGNAMSVVAALRAAGICGEAATKIPELKLVLSREQLNDLKLVSSGSDRLRIFTALVVKLPTEKWGMTIDVDADGPFITSVKATRPAASCPHLRPGYKILQIDGDPMDGASKRQVLRRIAGAGDRLPIVVEAVTEDELGVLYPERKRLIDLLAANTVHAVLAQKKPAEAWGLAIEVDAFGPYVSSVKPGRAAARCPRLQPGCKLLEIGGEPVHHLPKSEIVARIKKAKERLPLLIEAVTEDEVPVGRKEIIATKARAVTIELDPIAAWRKNASSLVVVMTKTASEKWGCSFDAADGRPGVAVSGIIPASVAARFPQLVVGSKVLAVNGLDARIADVAQIAAMIAAGGQQLAIEYDDPTVIIVTMKKKPAEQWGCSFRGQPAPPGAFISKIAPGSVSSRHAELTAGCRVVRMNGQDARNVTAIPQIIAMIRAAGDQLEIEIAAPGQDVPAEDPAPVVTKVALAKQESEKWGCSFTSNATSGISIARIADGSVAARFAGMTVGARLLRVDGRNVRNALRPQVVDLFQAAGTRLEVELAQPASTSPFQTVTMFKHEAEKWGCSFMCCKAPPGAMIDTVAPGSAGARYPEVEAGSKVLSVNGADARGAALAQLTDMIASGGDSLVMQIKVPARPAVPEPSNPGASVVVVSRQAGEKWGCSFKKDEGQPGAFISKIAPGSPSARCAGITVGCRLLVVNGKDVSTADVSELFQLINGGGDRLVVEFEPDPGPSMQKTTEAVGPTRTVMLSKDPGEKWGMKLGFAGAAGPVLDSLVPGAAASRCPELLPGARLAAIAGVPTKGLAKPAIMAMIKHAGNALSMGVQPSETRWSPVATKTIQMSKRPEATWGFALKASTAHPGCCISKLVEGSASMMYPDLRVGSCVTALNGQAVLDATAREIGRMVKDSGDILEVDIAMPAPRPEAASTAPPSATFRQTVVLTKLHGERWGIDFADKQGGNTASIVAITEAAVGSRYPELRSGDCVTTINGTAVVRATLPEMVGVIASGGNTLVLELEKPCQPPPRTDMSPAALLAEATCIVLTKTQYEAWGLEVAADAVGHYVSRIEDGRAASRYKGFGEGHRILDVMGTPVHMASTADVMSRINSRDAISLAVVPPQEARVTLMMVKGSEERWGLSFKSINATGPTVVAVQPGSASSRYPEQIRPGTRIVALGGQDVTQVYTSSILAMVEDSTRRLELEIILPSPCRTATVSAATAEIIGHAQHKGDRLDVEVVGSPMADTAAAAAPEAATTVSMVKLADENWGLGVVRNDDAGPALHGVGSEHAAGRYPQLVAGMQLRAVGGTDVKELSKPAIMDLIKQASDSLEIDVELPPMEAGERHKLEVARPGSPAQEKPRSGIGACKAVTITKAAVGKWGLTAVHNGPVGAKLTRADPEQAVAEAADSALGLAEVIRMTKEPEEKWGLGIKTDSSGPFISAVHANDAAGKFPEVKPGLRLLSVSDQDVTGLATGEVVALIHQAGDSLDVLLQQPGADDAVVTAPPADVAFDELLSTTIVMAREVGERWGINFAVDGTVNPVPNPVRQSVRGRIYNTTVVKEPRERWGMKLDFIDAEGPVLDLVYPGEPASRCPYLRPGHRVLEIAGVSVRGLTKPKVMAMIQESGDALVLQAIETPRPAIIARPVRAPGPVVTSVLPGTAAARYRLLQPGTRIFKVAGADVRSSDTMEIDSVMQTCGNTMELEIGYSVSNADAAETAVLAAPRLATELVTEAVSLSKTPEETWGLHIEADVITAVQPDHAAARCPQLQAGLRLLKIGGEDMSGSKTDAEIASLIAGAGNTLVLEVGRVVTVIEAAVSASAKAEDAAEAVRLTEKFNEDVASGATAAEVESPIAYSGPDVEIGPCTDLARGRVAAPPSSPPGPAAPVTRTDIINMVKTADEPWGFGVTVEVPGGAKVSSAMGDTACVRYPVVKPGARIRKINGADVDSAGTPEIVALMRKGGNVMALEITSIVPQSESDATNAPPGFQFDSTRTAVRRRNVIQKPSTEIASESVDMMRRPGERWGFDFRPRQLRVKVIVEGSPCSRTPIIQPGIVVAQLASQDVGTLTTQEINAIMQAPLKNLAVELELQRQAVHLSKQPGERWGIEFDACAPRGPTIIDVAGGSASARCPQLHAGVVLMAVAGKAVTGLAASAIADLIAAAGDSLHMEVVTDGLIPAVGTYRHQPQPTRLMLQKQPHEAWGVAFWVDPIGVSPPYITHVSAEGAAARYRQLQPGARLVAVAGEDTRRLSHDDILDDISECGNTLSVDVLPPDTEVLVLAKHRDENWGLTISTDHLLGHAVAGVAAGSAGARYPQLKAGARITKSGGKDMRAATAAQMAEAMATWGDTAEIEISHTRDVGGMLMNPGPIRREKVLISRQPGERWGLEMFFQPAHVAQVYQGTACDRHPQLRPGVEITWIENVRLSEHGPEAVTRAIAEAGDRLSIQIMTRGAAIQPNAAPTAERELVSLLKSPGEQWGFHVTSDGLAGARITLVDEGSGNVGGSACARYPQLQPGTRVMAIGGFDVTNATTGQLEVMMQMSGDHVDVEISTAPSPTPEVDADSLVHITLRKAHDELWGIRTYRDTNGHSVKSIMAAQAACRYPDLRTGCRIVKINGTPVAAASGPELRKLMASSTEVMAVTLLPPCRSFGKVLMLNKRPLETWGLLFDTTDYGHPTVARIQPGSAAAIAQESFLTEGATVLSIGGQELAGTDLPTLLTLLKTSGDRLRIEIAEQAVAVNVLLPVPCSAPSHRITDSVAVELGLGSVAAVAVPAAVPAAVPPQGPTSKNILMTKQASETWGCGFKQDADGITIRSVADSSVASRHPDVVVGADLLTVNGVDATAGMEVRRLAEIVKAGGNTLEIELGVAAAVVSKVFMLSKQADETWGCAMKKEADGVFISKVVPGSVSSQSPDVMVGSKVLKVNGQNVSHLGIHQVHELVAGSGNTVEVEVESPRASVSTCAMTRQEGELWGCSFAKTPAGGISISSLVAGSVSARCPGLRMGARVITLNGEDVRLVEIPRVVELIRGGGDAMFLEIELDATDPGARVVSESLSMGMHPGEQWGFRLDPSDMAMGLKVTGIEPGTPCDREPKMRAGVRIIKIAGVDVRSLSMAQAGMLIGKSANAIDLDVEHDPPPAIASTEVIVLTKAAMERWGIVCKIDGFRGPVVARIAPNMVAAASPGLKPGMRILRVNGRDVSGAANVREIAALVAAAGDHLTVEVAHERKDAVGATEVVQMSRSPGDTWGIRLKFDKRRGPVVKQIVPGTVAAGFAGLKPGSRVVGVNGKDVSASAGTQEVVALFAKGGDTIAIAIESDKPPPQARPAWWFEPQRIVLGKKRNERWGLVVTVGGPTGPTVSEVKPGHACSRHPLLRPRVRIRKVADEDVRAADMAMMIMLMQKCGDTLAMEIGPEIDWVEVNADDAALLAAPAAATGSATSSVIGFGTTTGGGGGGAGDTVDPAAPEVRGLSAADLRASRVWVIRGLIAAGIDYSHAKQSLELTAFLGDDGLMELAANPGPRSTGTDDPGEGDWRHALDAPWPPAPGAQRASTLDASSGHHGEPGHARGAPDGGGYSMATDTWADQTDSHAWNLIRMTTRAALVREKEAEQQRQDEVALWKAREESQLVLNAESEMKWRNALDVYGQAYKAWADGIAEKTALANRMAAANVQTMVCWKRFDPETMSVYAETGETDGELLLEEGQKVKTYGDQADDRYFDAVYIDGGPGEEGKAGLAFGPALRVWNAPDPPPPAAPVRAHIAALVPVPAAPIHFDPVLHDDRNPFTLFEDGDGGECFDGFGDNEHGSDQPVGFGSESAAGRTDRMARQPVPIQAPPDPDTRLGGFFGFNDDEPLFYT